MQEPLKLNKEALSLRLVGINFENVDLDKD